MSSIPYQVKPHKRAKNITIRVHQNGQVIVSHPVYASQKQVATFVDQQTAWIKSRLNTIAKHTLPAHQVYLFGKKYTKKALSDPDAPLGIFTSENLIFCNRLHLTKWGASHQRSLTSFIKQAAITYIGTKTPQLAEIMNVEFKTIRYKAQKTRWGSCSSSKNLNFNYRLAHFPPKVIDYVIVHELAHLAHLNHGPNFWQLVAQNCPNYVRHKNWLKTKSGGFLPSTSLS